MSRPLPLLLATLLLLCAQSAQAKPKSTQPDVELSQCQWAAEVQIVSVSPAQNKTSPPTIKVRLSKASNQLFYGAKAGALLDVHPMELSYSTTETDLKQLAGKNEWLLMVVNHDNRIVMVGKKQMPHHYQLRTWYDFNAWWMFSTNKHFGKTIVLDAPMVTLQVSAAEIQTLFVKRWVEEFVKWPVLQIW